MTPGASPEAGKARLDRFWNSALDSLERYLAGEHGGKEEEPCMPRKPLPRW